MKIIAITLTLLFSVACSSKEADKTPDRKEVAAAKPAASPAEVCKKAVQCLDAIAVADPERKSTYDGIRASIDRAPADQKLKQCRQALEGAAYNPKAPATCK